MAGDDENQAGQAAGDESTPWHFKLLMLALVLYLIYRVVQLGMWLAGKFF